MDVHSRVIPISHNGRRLETVISPHVIYHKLYNLRYSLVTAIMAENGIWPRAILCNADDTRVIHGKLTVVFLHHQLPLVY